MLVILTVCTVEYLTSKWYSVYLPLHFAQLCGCVVATVTSSGVCDLGKPHELPHGQAIEGGGKVLE